jgi:hypothetical protein
MVAARAARWEKDPCGLSLAEAVGEAVWLHGAAADRLGRGPVLVRELGPALAALLRDLETGGTP